MTPLTTPSFASKPPKSVAGPRSTTKTFPLPPLSPSTSQSARTFPNSFGSPKVRPPPRLCPKPPRSLLPPYIRPPRPLPHRVVPSGAAGLCLHPRSSCLQSPRSWACSVGVSPQPPPFVRSPYFLLSIFPVIQNRNTSQTV